MLASDFFDCPTSFPFTRYFPPEVVPWDWLPRIKEALAGFHFTKFSGDVPPGLCIVGDVFIHPSVELPSFGSIRGPAFIGEDCELRPGVYIRGHVIAGKGCVLGNSCEFKNCLLFDQVQVPHFSYVGDSILGNRTHLGAGVICSNLRLDQKHVKITNPDGIQLNSGLRKLGAILGDDSEVGCNTVLNPGSILGKRALVMPSMAFRGTLAGNRVAFREERILTRLRSHL